MTKEEKLKPRLMECVDRLKSLIEVDAPGVIIGAEAWHVFTTTLAAYGTGAASTMVNHLRDENLHSRAVCGNADCTSFVERPNLGICEPCVKELGLDVGMEEVLTGDPA